MFSIRCAAALAAFAACMSFGLPANAQTLLSAKVEPAAAKVNEPVSVTAQFDVSKAMSCNVRVHFGDGQRQDFKVNQQKDETMVLQHAYAKPGTYTVEVEPRRALPLFGCLGEKQRVQLVVAAPAPMAASAPAAGVAAASPCPEGWKLVAKSHNKKTGAFQCSAKPGAAAPAKKLDCPGDLNYVENLKKGQLACKAA